MASEYLSQLSASERFDLEKTLHAAQPGHCFICEEPIDYEIQRAHLDVDHVQPLADQGKDDTSNLALAHASCNRSKQAADLRVARVMARFDKIQRAVLDLGKDSPNLGDVLGTRKGSRFHLKLTCDRDQVRYGFPDLDCPDGTQIHEADLLADPLSGMKYFFAFLPIQYIFHDERINPRH